MAGERERPRTKSLRAVWGETSFCHPVGIADDMVHADPGKPNRDGYELYLRNALATRLSPAETAGCQITFHRVGPDAVEVCRILVPAAPRPVYLDGDLLIRAGSTSRALKTQDATRYIFQHWGTLA